MTRPAGTPSPGTLAGSQATGAQGGSGRVASPQRFTNRELSWLDFDRRVLALAEEPSLPLLERVKFLAIASRNLDEFMQVRVALLNAEYDSPVDVASPDGMTLEEQLAAVRARVIAIDDAAERVFEQQLLPALADEGIHVRRWNALAASQRKELARVFRERIFPVLTPLAVDPTHPFPYVSNLSFNIAVMLRDPAAAPSQPARFARIKVPDLLERFLVLDGGTTFVPVEEVIAAHLDELFPGMRVVSWSSFRVTRDADLDLEEDDADDLLIALESSLQRRRRLSDAVRLEVHASMGAEARRLLLEELELDTEDLYVRRGLLDLGDLWQIHEQVGRPDLHFPQWVPRTPAAFLPPHADEPPDVFGVLRERDVLVHHPYESFDHSVEAFLAQAASDPDVLAIKHTLYRSEGPDSDIGRTLVKAAHAGKQVVTLVELKARFDEEANIEWARTLEQAGVHVVYGIVGLKTHAKVMLVVRREGDRIRRYCHIGTGNYHPATARIYEDIGLFTSDAVLGADLSDLFNHLTGYSRQQGYRKLLVAPEALRTALLAQIREEIDAGDGHIVIKCNALSDPVLIDALYAASAADVRVDLIIRGICCLRPGVPGLSDRIRVRSVLGRYLEHSRLFRFGSAARGHRYFIGSADLMPRNLDRRVEVLTPVEAPALQARLEEVLDVLQADDALAWELRDRSWQRVGTRVGRGAQEELQERAALRARGQ